MSNTVWDYMYEKYGEQLEMTREQFYEMTIEELEYVSEILTNNESNDGLMERRVRLPKR